MIRAVGYIRVSTDGQAEEGVSLEAQRAKLQAFAVASDLGLVAIREDAGVSAKTLARPGLQAALADLREGRADALLVTKLDRLTRSVRDLGSLVEAYFAARFSLLSIADSVDTRTAGGRLVLHVLASVSQWEREAIGERTRDALAHLKAKGVRIGGEALGWRRTTETDAEGRRVWTPDLQEQATAQRIRELRDAGRSLRHICVVLVAEGRPTKRGGRWQPQTVAQVLARHNPTPAAPAVDPRRAA
ncbi:recombinase family protein [Anaeromyxobacter soli]|uniref:recombinase family protein n=1 Tax=Anaeromyxobacter soli TaxID=2922725 RepID=UPI001FAF79DD|nr:recombinase family protein [Anaeromyxobacter sp. SG29]